MNVHLAYGKNGLEVDLPAGQRVTLVEPGFSPPLIHPDQALEAALKRPLGCAPLRDLAQPADKVGIIFNDITRATPSSRILHAILGELAHLPQENVTLFNALGTHRPNTQDELRGMLDDELVERYRIVQNNAFDPATQVHLGATQRGHEIWLNRMLSECDLLILTGFIEPHFFAGFSGGGKAIMPGMAGITTILENHGAPMIGDPMAAAGITWGNPIWEEVHEIARMMKRVFLVNVTLNKDKQITGVFCGDLDEAHARGCEFVKGAALAPVDGLFDIVLTTNSGYPLDINLYQTVKGMSAAARVVKPGGSIILAAECLDGVPNGSMYEKLLGSYTAPQALLEGVLKAERPCPDQWQVQIQALLQLKADVYVYSEGLSEAQIRAAMLMPCRSIEGKIAELVQKYGPDARICALPEGPQTMPYVV